MAYLEASELDNNTLSVNVILKCQIHVLQIKQ